MNLSKPHYYDEQPNTLVVVIIDEIEGISCSRHMNSFKLHCHDKRPNMAWSENLFHLNFEKRLLIPNNTYFDREIEIGASPWMA